MARTCNLCFLDFEAKSAEAIQSFDVARN